MRSKRFLRNFLTCVSIFLITSRFAFSIPIWINEFHYDNDGGDVNEFIEIAGASSLNLNGLRIDLYNGSNQETYGTPLEITTDQFLPDQSNGFGTMMLDLGTLQNGPDAIALSLSGTLIQFLSYEGSFTAIGGVADGETSTALPVDQSSTPATGTTLQLRGHGTEYDDFAWELATGASSGSINSGQTFPAPEATDSDSSHSIPDSGATLLLFSGSLAALLAITRRLVPQKST